MKTRLIAAAAFAAMLASGAAAAPRPVPLLDAHTHLMVENLTADEEIALLRKAGLDHVLLMHTDPDAIAALARKYPGFVIPSLSLARPTVKGLHLDADTGPLMLRLRKARQICGFGEIPGFIFGDNPDFRSVYAAAAATGAPVNIHTDLAKPENVAALEAAASAYPKARFVLAHLGWTAGPELIGPCSTPIPTSTPTSPSGSTRPARSRGGTTASTCRSSRRKATCSRAGER